MRARQAHSQSFFVFFIHFSIVGLQECTGNTFRVLEAKRVTPQVLESIKPAAPARSAAVISLTRGRTLYPLCQRPTCTRPQRGVREEQAMYPFNMGEFTRLQSQCQTKLYGQKAAVTRIRTGVAAATTQSTNHYTITAIRCTCPSCPRLS